VRVDGPGSLLDIDLEGRTSVSFVGNSAVGEANVGIFEIVNGGRADFSSSLRFGNQAGAVGQLLVDGPGSELNIGTFIQAGWYGTGSFRVSDGGTLNQLSPSHISSIGRQVGSYGTFVIDGAGSKAVFAQTLFVATGDDSFMSEGTGTGVVEIGNGGLLDVGSVLAVRGQGSILLDNGTIRMGESGEMSVAGPNASLQGEGVVEGNLLVGNLATIAGTGSGIVVEGTLTGNGVVENLTVGGVRVASQFGRMILNNVGFANDAVITVAINGASDANGLLDWDSNTSLAGTHLEVSIETFITNPDWAAQILPAGVNYGFASVTVPEGWSFDDGLLSVSGDLPPPPPPAIVSDWVPSGTSVVWRSAANWSEDGFPNDGLTVARFGSVYNDGGLLSGVPTTTVTVSVSGAGGTQNVGAVVLGSDNTVDRRVRHNTANMRGAIAIHGVALDIEGKSFDNLLLANFSQDNSIRFQSWASTQLFDVIFMRSGIIHVENPDAMIRSTSRIYEPEGASVSITKTGAGILNLGVDFGAEDPARVSITGDMILREGIIQNTYSGGAEDGQIESSPYGFGNLVLQGGNVRSTTGTGRSVFNNVVLDGTVAFGSPDPDYNGNQTVSDNAGGSTTLASNSTVVIHNTTTWAQTIGGEFGLTKQGPGTLIFSGAGGPLSHSGPTVVEEGLLRGNTALLSSPVSVLPGATLAFGTASVAGPMFVGDSLTLSSGSNIVFRMNDAGSRDSVIVEGPVSVGGASLSLSLGYQPTSSAAIVLVENLSGDPVAGVFTYEGNSLPEGAEVTVTTGEFSQDFTITYEYNGSSVALLPVGGISSNAFGEWVAGYDLTGEDATPEANPAGDGFTNLAKFAFGVNPNLSVPSLADVSQSGESLVLRWNRSNDSEIFYQIDKSTNLVDWSRLQGASPSLMAVPDVTPPNGYERFEWSVNISGEGPRAFYRVKAEVDSSLLP
jgi:T5SS/PEP-CTERM-associated repeat protein/autotransporter-associated beta strand protein